MNASTTTPDAVNLATISESQRDATIAAMTDDQVFAADRVLRDAIRQLEQDRLPFLTNAGKVKARLSMSQESALYAVDRNLDIYRRCMIQLAPARDAAAQRRAAVAIQANARECTVSNLDTIARRLADLQRVIEHAKASVEAGSSCVATVADVQHELTWGVANMNFSSLITTAARADGLNI